MNKQVNEQNEEKENGIWYEHCECEMHVLLFEELTIAGPRPFPGPILFCSPQTNRSKELKSWTLAPRVQRYSYGVTETPSANL